MEKKKKVLRKKEREVGKRASLSARPVKSSFHGGVFTFANTSGVRGTQANWTSKAENTRN